MKISQLIEQLQEIEGIYGDEDIILVDSKSGNRTTRIKLSSGHRSSKHNFDTHTKLVFSIKQQPKAS